MNKLDQLHQLGQSTWLNYMRRNFIQSGELRHKIETGIQGVTANARVFEQALATCADYDDPVRAQVARGTPARKIHEALMVDDVQRAADMLHPVFEETKGLDGFASLELDPAVAYDTVQTVAAVRHLTARIDRGNIMIEIPATSAGVAAVEALTGDGVCINVTHIFSVDVYERVAQAYIAGLEHFFETHSVWRIAPTAVASFSLSPIDRAVDMALQKKGRPELQGQTALAAARLLYGRFREIFTGPRWEKLAARGGRVLRPKWTRIRPHNFSYPSTFYMDALIEVDSVMTFTPDTLQIFLAHGSVTKKLTANLVVAQAHMNELARCGIDLDAITAKLFAEHMVASDKQFQALISRVSQKRDELENNWQRLNFSPGDFDQKVRAAQKKLEQARLMNRIWSHETAVWGEASAAWNSSFSWLYAVDVMRANLSQLQLLAAECSAAGFTQLVLLGDFGMVPQIFEEAFGPISKSPLMPHPYPTLLMPETAVPSQILAQINVREQANPLFVLTDSQTHDVAALFEQLYANLNVMEPDKHFIIITTPGSALEQAAKTAPVWAIFVDDPGLTGPLAVFTYRQLLPAALLGTNVAAFLDRAAAMMCNAQSFAYAQYQSNLALECGVILGTLARNGRNRINIVPSRPLMGFGLWVAECLNTLLRGEVLPVVNDTGHLSTSEEKAACFVQLKLAGDTWHDETITKLTQAGYPVMVLHFQDLLDIGGQFFLWPLATAVAGHILQNKPFANFGESVKMVA